MENKSAGDWKSGNGALLSSWTGPRTVLVPRTEQGFGFTLRHFIVYPPESSVQDFYQEGDVVNDENDPDGGRYKRSKLSSLEPMDTIFVKYVKDGGPAHQAGLNTGDRIISVNGDSVTGKSYNQVIALIQSSDSNLQLLVVPRDEDILQMAYQGSAFNPTQDPYLSHSSSTSSSTSGGLSKVSSYTALTTSRENISQVNTAGRERKISAPAGEYSERMETKIYSQECDPKQLAPSKSYTSGLSLYREPPFQNGGGNTNRNVFMDRKNLFEAQAKQEAGAPSKTSTHYLGLFYPTPTKESKTLGSKDNVSRASVVRRRENILHPSDSFENIARSGISRTQAQAQARIIPFDYRGDSTTNVRRSRENLLNTEPSQSQTQSYAHQASSSPSRHSYPEPASPQANPHSQSQSIASSTTSLYSDGRTRSEWSSVPTRRISESSFKMQGLSTPDSSKSEYHSSRTYVPVVPQATITKNSKMSQSVDSINTRSNAFQSDRHWRPNRSSNQIVVHIGDDSGGGRGVSVTQPTTTATVQLPNYGTTFALTRSPISTQIEIRKSEPRPMVSQRKKQFESGQNSNTPVGIQFDKHKTEIEKLSSLGKLDKFSSKLANYEKLSDGSSPQQQPAVKLRKVSRDHTSQANYSPEPSRNLASQEAQPPQYQEAAPIRIYVSQSAVSAPSSPIVEIVPVPSFSDMGREMKSPNLGNKSEVHVQCMQDAVDGPHFRDSMDGGRHSRDSSIMEDNSGSKPVRKASFLSAVNAPHSRYLQSTPEIPTMECMAPGSYMGPGITVMSSSTTVLPAYSTSYSTVSPTVTLAGSPVCSSALTSTPIRDNSPSVTVRRKVEATPEDEAIKLQRRTSYLMATSKDRSNTSFTMDRSGSLSPPLPNLMMPPDLPMITPAKSVSTSKLKSFFGEKTPRILEAIEKRQDPASPIQEIHKEGGLYCKTDIHDGKRSTDRSWRPIWAVLRGHALYLHKEKKEAGGMHPLVVDEQPISIKSCIVDIAYDYTKKKHVFRLKTYNGSEYLFQADDQETMLSWIQAMQTNNNPDLDEKGLTNADLIIRKSAEYDQSGSKTSPQPQHKVSKSKLPGISFKSKMPHSPIVQRKSTKGEKDEKSKTWKGKLKSFRKLTSLSPAVPDIPEKVEVTGMFGVPLEACFPSPNVEFVPWIVDLCTSIVEARGLEITGIYRVPGNTAAVNLMQEELNKGIEYLNVEHEKWADVNVISSLLKAFFRKLPEPLVTNDLYQPFIEMNRIEDPKWRMLKLKSKLHKLPEHHFHTFRHVAEHLNTVASYGHFNKMDARNLAIVFGPTLVRKTDDDMASMVSDMSDQCRIVESLILHYEWFFDTWVVDDHIPVDEDSGSILSGGTDTTRVPKDEENTISAKEIVTALVSAANRKLQRKEQSAGSLDDLDSGPMECGFAERDIDKEIAKRNRLVSQQKEAKARSSPNLAMISVPKSSQALMTKSADAAIERRMTKSQEILDPDFNDWEFIDAPRETQSLYVKSSLTKHHSEDSHLDKNDELEISHGSGMEHSYSSSKDIVDGLLRLEQEARALREREQRRQRDQEKRRIEKQRVEQDIQRTKKELEIEERHSIEDLLQAVGQSWQISDYANRITDLAHKADSSSMVSDYSNTSSNGGDSKIQSSRMKYGSVSDYSSSASPLSVHLENRTCAMPPSGKAVVKPGDSSSGGKYFVSIGNNRSGSADTRTARIYSQDSVESLNTTARRAGSLEMMAEPRHGGKRAASKSKSSRRKDAEKSAFRNSGDQSKYFGAGHGILSRSNSVRRGSLDSLIDLYEKHDPRLSWASTDSEDGSDLLDSLTSTFDQKLQILLNPKYKLNGSARRLNKLEDLGAAGHSESAEDREHEIRNRLPPQIPLAQVSRFGLCSSNDRLEKRFQDPSLHKTPKSETKIGIASRFERNSGGGNGMTQVTSDSNLRLRAPPSSLNQGSASVGFAGSEPVDAKVSNVMVVLPHSQPLTAEGKITSTAGVSVMSASSSPVASPFVPKNDEKLSSARRDFRPISKSQKTEVNVSLSKLSREDRSSSSKRPQESVERPKGPRGVEYSVQFDRDSHGAKSRSASPPPAKKNKKSKRRRHTVGGTDDVEHFKALVSVTQSKDEQRKSAWEQLQPVVKDADVPSNRNLLSWMQKERLRGSSPDLSVLPPKDRPSAKF